MTDTINPTWKTGHPVKGDAGGTLRVYKFDNGFGAAVLRDFATGTLTLNHIASFNSPEINNYNLSAAPLVTLGDETALQAMLKDIAALSKDADLTVAEKQVVQDEADATIRNS